jgi:hypothetical protein
MGVCRKLHLDSKTVLGKTVVAAPPRPRLVVIRLS